MKRTMTLCAAVLCLTLALSPAALAAGDHPRSPRLVTPQQSIRVRMVRN